MADRERERCLVCPCMSVRCSPSLTHLLSLILSHSLLCLSEELQVVILLSLSLHVQGGRSRSLRAPSLLLLLLLPLCFDAFYRACTYGLNLTHTMPGNDYVTAHPYQANVSPVAIRSIWPLVNGMPGWPLTGLCQRYAFVPDLLDCSRRYL